MKRRIPIRSMSAAVAVLSLVGVAVTLSILADDGAEAEPRSVEFLAPPLTPPGGFPTGEPVFENPPPPVITDVSQLRRYSDYRIYPAGFVGTLEVERTVPLEEEGFVSDDPDELRDSSLYVELHSVPAELDKQDIDTADGTSEHILRQVFSQSETETGEPVHDLTVERVRWIDRPINIGAPPETGSFLDLSLEQIEGLDALVWRTIEGTRAEPYTIVRFFNADLTVETIVVGDGVSEDTTLNIAREIATQEDK